MGFNGKIFGYLKGIIIAIALLGLSIGIIVLTGQISFDGVSRNIDVPIIFVFLGGFIIQGAMEEILCRGFLMTSLSKRISIPTAILISSLAFAYPHFSSLFGGELIYGIIGVVNLLLVSVIFSMYVIKDGNLWIACAIHSLWNFCLFNICGLNLSGSDKATAVLSFSSNTSNTINGGLYGIEASIITTGVLFIYAVILIVKTKKVTIEKNGTSKIKFM